MRALTINYRNVSERKFYHAKSKPKLSRSLIHSGDTQATNKDVAQILGLPKRVYGPAKDARKKLFKIAAAKAPISVYGVTAPDALAAPGTLSFGKFARHPETLKIFGPQDESDATRLLLEFQKQFVDNATRKALARFVRRNYSGKARGFRYWDRLAGSIWKIYQGVLRSKQRTGKAHDGEVKRLACAAQRAGKEAKRLALRHKPKSPIEKRKLAVAQLRRRALWLRQRANKNSAQARCLIRSANRLKTEARILLTKATQHEKEI